MSNLFKKAMLFTDIHLGLKTNSEMHNQDCLQFVEWMSELAKKEGCETCIFLGDYHNNRATMNIRTMHYAVQCLEHLSRNFSQTFFITGNHDQFFKDKRDVQSVEWAKHIPNITVINDFFNEGNVTLLPWLVGGEHSSIKKIKSQYMFGHFELPSFLMNASIVMPDHGDIKNSFFSNIGHVFSGHFHKRQQKENITYIGNCFPHNFGDANDDERGCAILEWGKEAEFHAWPGQPLYRIYQLSDILVNTEKLLLPKMYVKANIDVNISYEESSFVKETLLSKYELRELTLVPGKPTELNEPSVVNINFKSVDTIVMEQIGAIDSAVYDPKILLEIYKNL